MRVRGKGLFDHFVDSGGARSKRFNAELAKEAERLAAPDLNAARTPWHHYFVYPFVSLFLQLLLGWPYAFPDGGRPGPACGEIDDDAAGARRKNSHMCGLEEVLEKGHDSLRFIMALVLGGYVVSTVALWRLRRTNYCALCGATRNLLIQISTLVPESKPDAKALMSRWVVLGYEMAMLKARGTMDAEEGRRYLESRGLLAEGDEEWDNMVKGDRHTTVWYWVQRKSVSLAEEGVIVSEQRLQTLCGAVTLIRDKANDLMSCIDRDQPLAYTSAVGITLCFSAITMFLWKGIQWAIWFYETNGLIWTEPRMYVDFCILASYIAILAILFDIDQVLYNPFGPRELDVPHEIVGGGLKYLAARLGSSTRCFPSSSSEEVAAKVQMANGEGESMAIDEKIEYERNEVFGALKRKRYASVIPVPIHLSGNGFHNSIKERAARLSETVFRSSTEELSASNRETVQQAVKEETDVDRVYNW